MILVVGSINMVTLFDVPSFPQTGETVFASNVFKFPGGKGANQAVAASKFGADVVMLGCVGSDTTGEQMINVLKESGVNTDYVLRNNDVNTASAYTCMSEYSEKSLIVDLCANRKITPDYLLANENLFMQADYCILNTDIPVETLRKVVILCRRYDVKVVLIPSPHDLFEKSSVKGIDYVIINEDGVAALLGYSSMSEISSDSLVHFMRCYAFKNLIITMSDHNILHVNVSGYDTLYSNTNISKDDSFDSDAFSSALIAALSNNTQLSNAINFSMVAAALTENHPGRQISYPTAEEINTYIGNNST